MDDELIPELARIAHDGVHEPEYTPFANGWTDRTAEDWDTRFARYFWAQRGAWEVDAWALPFAVLLDGVPIGVQQLTAESFPALRTVSTGSWLARSRQGQGLGTEMRAAVLSFGFQTLQAELAISGAFSTNLGSIRVSEKIGYLPNGVRRDKARDRAVEALLFRLPRERWETMGTIEVEIEGFEGCERLFGLGTETRER